MKKKQGINKDCKACGTSFYVPAYRSLTASFCSLACQNHKQYNKSKFICEACNKEFEDSPSRNKRKYCSIECQHAKAQDNKERRKTQKSLTKLKRGSSGRTLRTNVFRIKPKQCEICNYNEYDFCLDIHHIDNDPTNNNLENLAVLCCMCHKKLHKGIITYASSKI